MLRRGRHQTAWGKDLRISPIGLEKAVLPIPLLLLEAFHFLTHLVEEIPLDVDLPGQNVPYPISRLLLGLCEDSQSCRHSGLRELPGPPQRDVLLESVSGSAAPGA